MSNAKSVRAIAAAILDEIANQKISLEMALNKYNTHTLSLNVQDQSLLQELCYGCLRWYPQFEFLISTLLPKPLRKKEHRVFALLVLGIYQLMFTRIPEYAAIAATVDAARASNKNWATGLINAVLRNFSRHKKQLLQQLQATALNNLSAYYAHPLWFINAVRQSWPHQWQEVLHANNQHPPMHLRVNTQAVSRANYLQLLAQHNITATSTPHCDTGITLAQPCAVNNLPYFQSGWVSVQDVAAQFAADLLELNSNMHHVRILDACAAPGGKLTHIIETIPKLLQPVTDSVAIVAIEIDQTRLQKLKENLARLDASLSPSQPPQLLPPSSAITLLQANAMQPHTWWNGKKFSHILLDAPCSATGVIRRHPDIKLLKTPATIAKLAEQQLELLEALWPLLADNGILIYITCSILPTENWQVIERFLENHKNKKDVYEKVIAADWGVATKFGRQILPGVDNMDGFYYARLGKIKS